MVTSGNKIMEYGICPVCNGSKMVALTEKEKQYHWNKGKTHERCTNCGGQYMMGAPTGQVRLNSEGQPCVHKYVGTSNGRCLHSYTCKHCGDFHQIDSGD